ncbi:MAG TPA: ABC transporter substrate-binding protein, partial [Sphingomonas sp.]
RLWGGLAASLRRVGIEARRVALDEPAELQLVDAVAPYDDPRWYLASACRPCGAEADERLEAARIADTLAERAARSAEADAALTADVAFIPLARPLRWSLVAPGLTAWAPNARAWHPLNHLRLPPT